VLELIDFEIADCSKTNINYNSAYFTGCKNLTCRPYF